MAKPPEPLPLEEHPWIKSLSGFCAYYGAFFRCVLSQTLHFFGWSKRTLLVPVLFVVGAIVALATLEGELVREEILTTLAFGLIPIGGLAVVVAVVNIIRAPWLLNSQAKSQLEQNTSLIE